jgi:hypothetical protein
VTSADTPYRPASPGRWRTFLRWCSGRPFWGGVITILSGVVFFLSGHITFAGIKISFGPQEFLGWVIPLLLLLCGVLMLLTPAQRIFYGVLAAAVSVGGLLGLNLGGFFVGMLLGIVGGALGASWAPEQLPSPADTPPSMDTPLSGDTPPPAGAQDASVYQEDAPVYEESEELLPYQRSGPLSDTLPTSTTSPLGVPPVEAPDPGGTLPRRSPRGLVVILLVMTAAAAGLGLVRTASPAAAAPVASACGASAAAAAPAKKPATPQAPAAAPAAAAASRAPSAAPPNPAAPTSAAPSSATPAGGGTTLGDTLRNIVTDVVDGFGKLLGIGDSPSPSPSAPAPTTTSPAAGASPIPRVSSAAPPPAPRKSTAAPKPAPTRSSSSPCPAPKALAAPADNTTAAVKPATQLTATLSQVQLTFDGVTALPTATGSIPVLEFSMQSSESTPFELRVPVNDRILDYRSTDLKVSGTVRFYTSRLRGTLQVLGLPLVPVDLTPGDPVSLLELSVLPAGSDITFVDVNLELVLVRADTLTAANLTIAGL